MKFGRTLREETLKEWRFYAVDYKALKKTLKHDPADVDEFHRILENSKSKLSKFYHEKENWANNYMHTLEENVGKLRESSSRPSSTSCEIENIINPAEDESFSSSNNSSVTLTEDGQISDTTPTGVMDFSPSRNNHKKQFSSVVNAAWLKGEYRRVGRSDHFKHFIYAKKSLATFSRELELLIEFLGLNQMAFSKILKKFDKRTGQVTRDESMEELLEKYSYLSGAYLSSVQEHIAELLDEVDSMKPRLPERWEERKVYTIGCFDLFHRGHQNVLLSLREFGYYIVAGIHDDESYFKLKNKYTIDNLETRMKNVKPFVDQLYVIPSTDPLLYIQSVVSQQDIDTGSCCYARGDDMLQFPGREWVESVMPVHFVPRTESCSSTLLRTIYHAEDESLREKAAFAKTRYDGKPIDDDGNVLKLMG